jgi:amidophosphoribosyltransferase
MSDMDLFTRRVIVKLAGPDADPHAYLDPDKQAYQEMIDMIRQTNGFTTLSYQRLDDMLDAFGIDRELLCTYCWDGRE